MHLGKSPNPLFKRRFLFYDIEKKLNLKKILLYLMDMKGQSVTELHGGVLYSKRLFL